MTDSVESPIPDFWRADLDNKVLSNWGPSGACWATTGSADQNVKIGAQNVCYFQLSVVVATTRGQILPTAQTCDSEWY